MNTKLGVLDTFNHAIKICKEQGYLALGEKIHKSQLELVTIESDCRREKASAIIKSIQICDRELKILMYEYEKVKEKYNLEKIPAIENYMEYIGVFRKNLVAEKNKMKNLYLNNDL